MKEGNISPFQEAPVPEKAARMMTQNEWTQTLLHLGPEEVHRIFSEMGKLSKAGVKADTTFGEILDNLKEQSK